MSTEIFYRLLTLLSMVIFAGLGWFLANRRNRNGILWAVGGALLPLVLLVLLFLKPVADEPEDDAGELSEG